MSAPRQSVVLCEGYDDRAFWAGCLERLGCRNLWSKQRRIIYDPWGAQVKGGDYAYETPSGEFLRIVPCHGDRSSIRDKMKLFLHQSATHPVVRLVACWDPDTEAHGSADADDDAMSSIRQLAKAIDSDTRQDEHGDLLLTTQGVQTMISVVCWRAHDGAVPGVPLQQTLERLSCAALAAAYPECGPTVSSWLKSRPSGPGLHDEKAHKAHAWSYMAGWYSHHGWEDFYKNLWRDDRISGELERRLVTASVWRVITELAR